MRSQIPKRGCVPGEGTKRRLRRSRTRRNQWPPLGSGYLENVSVLGTRNPFIPPGNIGIGFSFTNNVLDLDGLKQKLGIQIKKCNASHCSVSFAYYVYLVPIYKKKHFTIICASTRIIRLLSTYMHFWSNCFIHIKLKIK